MHQVTANLHKAECTGLPIRQSPEDIENPKVTEHMLL